MNGETPHGATASRVGSGRPRPERSPRDRGRRIRPARVSELPRTRSGEAPASTRKRAGRRGRSARTRSTVRRSGRRWNSSMTTRPRRGPSASAGSAKRARSAESSMSKRVTGPRHPSASARANVVLPTWRGPTTPTTGNSRRSVASLLRWSTRWITPRLCHEISVPHTEISWLRRWTRLRSSRAGPAAESDPNAGLVRRRAMFGAGAAPPLTPDAA